MTLDANVEIEKARDNLMRFLNACSSEGLSEFAADAPIVPPGMGTEVWLRAMKKHFPTRQAHQTFASPHQAAVKKASTHAWLAQLAAEGSVLAQSRAMALGYLEQNFPLTGQPLRPLLIGERALAALVTLYNLEWYEAQSRERSFPKSLVRWAGWGKSRLEEETLDCSRQLVALIDWDLPPEPSAEMVFLHLLLERVRPTQQESGRARAERIPLPTEWEELFQGLLARSPITRLLWCDRLSRYQAHGRTGPTRAIPGTALPRPKTQENLSEGSSQRTKHAGEMRASQYDDDWRGLREVMARPDFEIRCPLLQKFLEAISRMDENSSERARILESIVETLGLQVEHPDLASNPTLVNLELFLLQTR